MIYFEIDGERDENVRGNLHPDERTAQAWMQIDLTRISVRNRESPLPPHEDMPASFPRA